MADEELNSMWDRLESSLNNPYAFDLLLDEAKAKREKEIEDEQKQKMDTADKKAVKEARSGNKIRSNSTHHKRDL
jgi:hypothetical protein